MVTSDQKTLRLELPSTSGMECEIREEKDSYIINFYQNDRQVNSSSISISRLDQDRMVDLLSEAGVEFFSFSAIFDVADLLVNTIKSEFQAFSIGDEPTTTSESSEAIESAEVSLEDSISISETRARKKTSPKRSKITIPKEDKLLKRFNMLHSKSGFAAIYFTRKGNYSVVLSKKDEIVSQKAFSKKEINQDALVELISESGIDFLSFSAIYDSAEQIESIIMNPVVDDDSVVIPDMASVSEGGSVSEKDSSAESQDEISLVDLSDLDASEYKKAEDFDKFIVKVKESVEVGQPLPVKEVEIAHSDGVVCIILRKSDAWYLRFRYPHGKLSKSAKIDLDQDEIARLINKEIPQISFSYLYDASELIFKTIEQLALRPMDQIIINVAVGHFLNVIEQYEKEDNFTAASKVTEVLLKRFRREKNSKGILRFGKKLIDFLKKQGKNSKVIKLQSDLVAELLELDIDTSVEFVYESIETLVEQKKFLNAANLCDLVLDHYLAEKIRPESISTILSLAKKQVGYYKQARLPVVMWENALRYAHFGIKQIGKADDLQTDQRDAYLEDIIMLVDTALEVQEEKKANFEIISTLDETIQLLKEIREKNSYQKYANRLILTLETQGKKEKALEKTLEVSNYLMDSGTYVKACEFANQAIKIYYELNKIDDAVNFSLEIVQGLINLQESDAAKNYLKFAEDLVAKAYKDDDSSRIEKQLAMGDLLGKLGMKDRSKTFIQNALQTIEDPKKRETIVLKYVDDLLASQAVLTAQEMVNLELSRLLSTKKTKDVIEFCCQFIDKLKEYAHNDMVFEYIRYISNLMVQTDDADYDLIMSFVKDLLNLNEVDKGAAVLDQLVILQTKGNEYTRAIDTLSRFIEHLLEKTERYDLLQKYIFEVAETYRKMGDTQGSVEQLVKYQNVVLDRSVDLAQKITDIILKEYEREENYKKAIEVVSKIIDKQMASGNYQDAYIFSVQNARYIESSGSITDVIKYLGKMRNRFLEHEQFDDASKTTDLIYRFGKTHNQTKLAIQSLKEYTKLTLKREDYPTAIKFTLSVADLFEEEDKPGKALEFLQMVFNTTFEHDKEITMQIYKRILEIHKAKDETKKIIQKVVIPLLDKYSDVSLLNLMNEILSPPLGDFIQHSKNFYNRLVESSTLTPDSTQGILELVARVYQNEQIESGDSLVNHYTNSLLFAGFVTEAIVLMSTMLEKTRKPFNDSIDEAFDFITKLVTNSYINNAREFLDRIIQKVTSDPTLAEEKNHFAALVAKKFAYIVADENPDLASEYAYLASDYLRGSNDFDGVVEVYEELANHFSSSNRVIRSLNRGAYICKKFKAKKHEAKLLTTLTQYMLSVSDKSSQSAYQQTVEKLEELEDLDVLFSNSCKIMKKAVTTDNLVLVYDYLEYNCKLAAMINQEKEMGGILTFMLNHFGELKNTEIVDFVKKLMDEITIHPKKFKKEYKELSVERNQFLQSIVKEEDLKPEISEKEIPSLVETTEIIPPTVEPVIKIQSGTEMDKGEDEFVDVIQQYEPEAPLAEVSLKHPQEAIPDLGSLVTSETAKSKSSPEPEPTIISSDILEVPEKKEGEKLTTVLSDDEITGLFAQTAPIEQTEQIFPPHDEEILHETQKIVEEGVTLSNDEISALFSSKDKQIIPSITPTEIKPQKASDEEEWEVDAFGRLIKKTPTPPPVKTEVKASSLSRKGAILKSLSETPDMSVLESKFEKPATGQMKPTQLKGLQIESDDDLERKKQLQNLPNIESLEMALVDTQNVVEQKTAGEAFDKIPKEATGLFDKDSSTPFASIVDSIVEDESTSPSEMFGIPEVSYEEIPTESEPTESDIQPPDLIDLFSNALSELGSISGESGETSKEKKKKSKK
ncbi:MAG: hypothetical protein ACW97W_07090 [Candidatus Hodarchaeales archaeon]|jgi:hypothetical protein